MIGTLGDIVFKVSSDQVLTFQNLARNSGGRYHKHQVVAQKAKLEFLGAELETIKLPVRLDVGLGINPLNEITRVKEYVNAGARLALIIGGKFLGDWVIETFDESWDKIDNRGNLLVANVNLNLLESEPG